MKTSKRPWTRAELALFAAPLLFALIAGGAWFWRRAMPYSLEVPGASNISRLEFSPDSSRLAVFFDGNGFKGFKGLRGQVYDVQNRSKICDLTPNIGGYYYWPSWSPDGQQIVAGYGSNLRGTTKIPIKYTKYYKYKPGMPTFSFNSVGQSALWDAQTGKLRGDWLYAPLNEESYGRVYFSSDGKTLIGAGKPLSTFDAVTGRRLSVTRSPFASTKDSRINRKLGLIALRISQPDRFRVLDSKTNKVVWEPQTKNVTDFEWCGDTLAVIDWHPQRKRPSGANESSILLWDGKTRSILPSPPGGGRTFDLVFSPDQSTMILVNGELPSGDRPAETVNGEFVVWSLNLKRALWSHAMPSRITGMQWSPDGHYLAMRSDGYGTMPTKLWVFDRAGKVCLERGVDGPPSRWSSDSTSLAITYSSYGEIKSSIIHPARIEVIRFPK